MCIRWGASDYTIPISHLHDPYHIPNPDECVYVLHHILSRQKKKDVKAPLSRSKASRMRTSAIWREFRLTLWGSHTHAGKPLFTHGLSYLSRTNQLHSEYWCWMLLRLPLLRCARTRRGNCQKLRKEYRWGSHCWHSQPHAHNWLILHTCCSHCRRRGPEQCKVSCATGYLPQQSKQALYAKFQQPDLSINTCMIKKCCMAIASVQSAW